MSSVVVAVAIGSNLGDRNAHVEFARVRLKRILDDFKFSSIHDTEPVDVPAGQERFLNAAAVGSTDLSAVALLASLFEIERERGRERPFPLAPRTLDLDLILFGDEVIEAPGLVVPHPRFRGRAFVLAPLAEVAGELVDPVTGKNVRELLQLVSG
jgi:2-amino-4-hydroxy-6-hydroxymethyldihydropteridine diphosphokinase